MRAPPSRRVLAQMLLRWRGWIGQWSWERILLVVAVVVEIGTVWRLTWRYDRPPMTPDAGIFQHIGWYLTEGGCLYVDAWEPKLPLSFETTAALSLLAGDDMYLFHILNIALMMGAAVGIVLLVGALTYHLTEDSLASLVAGLSMFLLPGFAVRPAYGFKAKYFLLLTGLLALFFILNDRPLASGIAAAASVGYWQLGAIFPLLVVGLTLRQRDWRAFGAVALGGIGFTILMIAPVILLWESVSQMIAQAVLIPLLIDEKTGLLKRVVAGVVHFKWASPFILLGLYGLWRRLRYHRKAEDWWVFAGAGWFGLIVLFIDFEPSGYTDLITGLAFVAIGVGLLVSTLHSERRRSALTGALLVIVLLNVVAFGSIGLIFSPVDTPAPIPMEDLRTNDRALALSNVPDDTPDIRYIYWNRVRPETCHYRLSLLEVNWLELVGEDLSADCSDISEVRRVLSRT